MKLKLHLLLGILFILSSCRQEFPETYFVEFVDIEFNSLGLVQMVEEGDKIDKPNDPEDVTGAYFFGWYNIDADPFDFDAPVHQDQLVIAVYMLETRMIIFDYDYDDKKDTAEVYYGYPSEEIIPQRDGFVFDGWKYMGRDYDFSQPIYEDITLTAQWASLYTYKKNTNSYISQVEDGIIITGYGIENPTHVTIPESIDGFPVVYIEDDAFFPFTYTNRNTSLISVDASQASYITSFNRIFAVCENLETVILGDALTSIENDAFYGCSSLKSITIPPNVIKIHNSVFMKSGLESITLNENLEELYQDVFRECKSLKSITFPEKLWLISTSCCLDCSALEEITFEGGSIIEQGVFDNCTSLKKVTITATRYVNMHCQACPEDMIPDDFSSFYNTPIALGTEGAVIYYPRFSDYPNQYGWKNLKARWEEIDTP